MTVLGIRGESGIAWNPTKGNHVNPIKRRLYKGLKHTKLGWKNLGVRDSKENTGKHWGTERN